MPVCCMDTTIGARIVAVVGLVASAVVVMELATELVIGEGEGRVAVLLGLSLDEFSSRQRHSLHATSSFVEEEEEVVAANKIPGDQHGLSELLLTPVPRPTDTHHITAPEYEVLLGFLVFALAYGMASALLAYASIFMKRAGSLAWLGVHALAVASQAARLVVQVSERSHGHGPGHLVLTAGPLDDVRRFQHVHQHQDPHREDARSEAVSIALSAAQLLVSVYMWLVVLLAQREWSAAKKPYRPAPALGDEGFALSEVAT